MPEDYQPKFTEGEWVRYQGTLWKVEHVGRGDSGPTYTMRPSNSTSYVMGRACEELDPYLQKA